MADLVIVESPTKVKTIGKYLGADYDVVASVGHIRDLPKSKLGVEIENNFAPVYENKKDKAHVIKELKSKAKKSKNIYLATDPDREGEAISWHLAHILELDDSKPIRVTFSEITKTGVKAGMSAPRKLDMALVNAQQARRILDRIVGYKLSPFLWKTVRRGLSAGRVQSVAVRIICDREEEVKAFVPVEYWSIEAEHTKTTEGSAKTTAVKEKKFTSHLTEWNGKKAEIANKAQADEILSGTAGADFVVTKIKKGTRRRTPAPPFTTSTLQQEASKRHGFSSKRTMAAAQALYEGIELPDKGQTGLITYMRTDSLRISDEAKAAAAAYITEKYGSEYLPDEPRVYKTKKNTQDAHEAVRPADILITPAMIRESASSDQYKLYKLIFERFMASQMASAVYNTVSADITAGAGVFRASGNTVKFDGFTVLYEETAEDENILPELNEGDVFINVTGVTDVKAKPKSKKANLPQNYVTTEGKQHFTQPPPRYTEATLIKALEENGIGRPSTYAPTISTIIDRRYIERELKQLRPTVLGMVTTKLLREHFDNILDTKFTAKMEDDLDKIEEGGIAWERVLGSFYKDFEKTLDKAEKDTKDTRVSIPREETDVKCELCGRNMVVILGRNGKFLGCSGYPECKNTKNVVTETGGNCPKCGKRMLAKKSKKGRTFFGCENYETCGFMTWDTPMPEKCPKCGATLFKKGGKDGGLYCAGEDCGYSQI